MATQLWATTTRTARRSATSSSSRSRYQGGSSSVASATLPLFLMPALAAPAARRYRSSFFDSFNLSLPKPAFSARQDPSVREQEVSSSQLRALPREEEARSQALVEAFTAASRAGDVESLCALYPRLAAIQRAKERGSWRLLGYLELQGAYRALLAPHPSLAVSEDTAQLAAQTAQSIFQDAKPLWRCFLRPLDAHWALRAFLAAAPEGLSAKLALRELLRLAQSVPESMQRPADWGLVLSLASKLSDARGARLVARIARRRGVILEAREKEAFFAALCKGGQAERALSAAFESTDSGVSIRPLEKQPTRTLGVLLSGLVRAQVWKQRSVHDEAGAKVRFEQVQEVAQALHESLLHWCTLEESRAAGAEWRALLEHASSCGGGGASAALALVEEAIKERRHVPDERTFVVLVRCHGAQLSALAEGTELDVLSLFERVSRALRLPAGRRAYAIALAALLAPSPGAERAEPGQIHEATLLYARMRAKGITPNAPALHPLIRAHTEAFIPNLPTALSLVEDITRAGEEVDRATYLQLLQGCVNARDVQRALGVLQRMSEERVAMEQESRLGWTLRLMSAARSHSEAHRVYESVRDLPVQRSSSSAAPASASGASAASSTAPFSPRGWNALLDTFRQLVFHPDEDYPEVQATSYSSFQNMHLTLSFVRDMIASNQSPSLGAFTTLFDYYGKAARSTAILRGPGGAQGRQERMEALTEGIQTLEDLLRSTPGLSPDLPLITAIMDAYNRVGLLNRVLEIWRRLILVRAPLTSACVGVVLDACGWAARPTELAQVWKTANARHAGVINRGVWNAYVEATARCGDVQAAVDTAFGEMRDKMGSEALDARLAGMLLRFAARERDRDMKRHGALWFDLCDRIREQAPDVWEELRKHGVPGATSTLR